MAPEDAIAIVTYVCLVLACISVSLRTVVRYKWLDVGMRAEDWLMIVALLVYLPFCAVIIGLTVVERRNPILTESSADTVLLLLTIGESLFMITSIAFRISLAIFFRRFLVDRTQLRLVLGVTGLYCILATLGFFICLLQCGSFVHLAARHIDGKCIPTSWWNGIIYAHGALSAFADWFFALLPILILWKSSIPTRSKVGVSMLMVLAVCGSLCAVLRTIYVETLDFGAAYFDPRHPTYYHVTALIINMAVLEMGIGITTASVACLMPLFRRCASLCRRRLPGKPQRQYFDGMRAGYASTTLDETPMDTWEKYAGPLPNVISHEVKTMDLENLGILPDVDSTTDEDKIGKS